MDDLRLRNNSTKFSSVSGKILGKHRFSTFTSFLREFKPVYKDNRNIESKKYPKFIHFLAEYIMYACLMFIYFTQNFSAYFQFQRIIWLGLVNIFSLMILLKWCNNTQSMGLLAYTYLIFFDTLCLCICALSIWVEQKKPNSQYTFGYERVEVLAVFVSTTFSIISSLFTVKKSIVRWIQQSQVHTGRLFPGIIVAFLCHMLITYCMKNKGLNLVICASDSSWLQNRMSSISQSLCHIVPGWNGTSWPRINPFSLLGCAAGMISVFALFFIDIYDYYSADAIAGIFISTLTCITMYPMSSYSAKILLQGTPPHVTDLLDKCLREASTLDGVLEFRNEHFWLLGFDKIVGTIHVRIRRDANEQIVLSHLLNKLSSLVTDITIQVFKDEWAWSSSTRQILNESFMKFPPITEVYAATSIPVVNSSSTIKEALSSSNSAKTNSSSTYTSPAIKIPEQTHASYSYATIPLPPSLSGSQASKTKMQHFAVDMMPETVFMSKHMSSDLSLQSSPKMYQTAYSQMPTSQASKYGRELTINPLFTTNSDYIKAYKS